MKSRQSTREMKNGGEKTSPVYEQMKHCFQELDLPIHSEGGNHGELGIHSRIGVMDVCAGVSVLYNEQKKMITLHALFYELSENEHNAVHNLLLNIHDQFETVELCNCPGTTVIGCTATLCIKDAVLNVQYFCNVLGEAVITIQFIAWFVCGLRYRMERTSMKLSEAHLN